MGVYVATFHQDDLIYVRKFYTFPAPKSRVVLDDAYQGWLTFSFQVDNLNAYIKVSMLTFRVLKMKQVSVLHQTQKEWELMWYCL